MRAPSPNNEGWSTADQGHDTETGLGDSPTEALRASEELERTQEELEQLQRDFFDAWQ